MNDTPSTPQRQPQVPMPQPIPHVVHIRAKPGGIWSVLGIVAGLALLGIVFIFGIVIGVGAMFAGSSMDTVVMEQTYRESPGARRNKIAILPIEGIINDSQAQFVRAGVDHILDDTNVRAVILRVESPGGGVTASDQIWYEVERLKNAGLPVVASYGGLAASGGYYVSCGADHIIAQETTITGSIGVIAQVMTLQNLMDKVGVQPVTLVATGSPEKAVGNDIFREWNERDQERILSFLDHAYEIFTKRVAAGRSDTLNDKERLALAANGSVFTAAEALENGLIDGIGYLDDAVVEAERRAGIATGGSHVVRITAPPSLASAIFGAQAGFDVRSMDADSIRSFVNDVSTPRVMYLMW